MDFKKTIPVNNESRQTKIGDKEKIPRISRRDFLKCLGGGAITLGLAACGVKPPSEDEPVAPESTGVGDSKIVVPTETAEPKETVPTEKLENLSDIYNCEDKIPPVPLKQILQSVHQNAAQIGYVGYPEDINFRTSENLKRFESIRQDPNQNVGEATEFINSQIQYWREKPSPKGNSEFVGFSTEEEKAYKLFILDAMHAVWGSNKFDWVIGRAELKRDFFGGGWSSLGNVMLGASSLSWPEERRLVANISLHEIVVGHGMDPLAGSGFRSVDMRDALAHRDKWYSVSKSAAKFLSVVGGPEQARQEAYDFAKSNLSNNSLDELKNDQPAIYSALAGVGEKISTRSNEYLDDIGETESRILSEEVNNLGSYAVNDEHKNVALALSIHKRLQQVDIGDLSGGKLISALISVLRREVRQEHEMVAEAMRHVLTMNTPPVTEVQAEFRELESFVQFVLDLYGSGKTLNQARADLKAVMDSYIA